MKYNVSFKSYIWAVLFMAAVVSCTPKMVVESTTPEVTTPVVDSEAWRAQAPSPSPAPEFNLGDYEEFSLNNGLKVIVVENHKLPVVSFQLFIDRGPILEGDKTGLTSIVGQMLRRGTKNKTKAEIDEEIEFIAATISPSSSGFYGSALKKHTKKLLDLATELIYQPSFPEEEFDKIIQETKSGLTFSKSDPNTISSNVSSAILYGKDHAYGEFVTEETIDNISLDDVKEFYNKYMIPNNAYLIVVGDIDVAEAKQLSTEYFSNWEADPNFKTHVPEFSSPPAHNSVSLIPKEGAVQSVIKISSTLRYPHNSPDRLAASVMNTILGGYFGSRLNKNIREDKGYTYGIRSSLSPDRYIGSFSTSASVRNQVTDSTITEILKEMKRLQTEKVSEEELSLVKNVLTGQFARGLESPQTIARNALNIARYDLPMDYYQTYLSRLEKLTAEDIQAAAKKYLNPDQLQIVIVGNDEEIASGLVAFDGDGKIDYYDINADKVDKKPMVKAADLDITAEEIIAHYIDAIGGQDKLTNVKSVVMVTKAETPMGDLSTTIKTKDNSKVNMKMESQGMTIQEIIFNGLKAKVGGMQGSQIIDDPKEFSRFKSMANFCPESSYFSSGEYKIELKGTEELETGTAYKIRLTSMDGTVTTEYYDMKTGLKQKMVNTVSNNGQEIVTQQLLGDYKEVDGIKIPHTITFSGGGMPFEMVQKVEQIEFNTPMDDSVFKVE